MGVGWGGKGIIIPSYINYCKEQIWWSMSKNCDALEHRSYFIHKRTNTSSGIWDIGNPLSLWRIVHHSVVISVSLGFQKITRCILEKSASQEIAVQHPSWKYLTFIHLCCLFSFEKKWTSDPVVFRVMLTQSESHACSREPWGLSVCSLSCL